MYDGKTQISICSEIQNILATSSLLFSPPTHIMNGLYAKMFASYLRTYTYN